MVDGDRRGREIEPKVLPSGEGVRESIDDNQEDGYTEGGRPGTHRSLEELELYTTFLWR